MLPENLLIIACLALTAIPSLSLLIVWMSSKYGYNGDQPVIGIENLDDFDMSDVTVLIPAYNAESIIAKAIHSLRKYKQLQVVVVADHCEDNTIEVVRQASQGMNVEIIEHVGRNPSKTAALNYGLRHVNTTYIALLDADTCLSPNSLALLKVELAKSKVDAITGHILPLNKTNRFIDRVTQWHKYISHVVIRYGRYALFGVTDMPGQLYLARTNSVKKVCFREGILSDDMTFSFQAIAAGLKFQVLPVVVGYEIPRTSFTSWMLQLIRQKTAIWQAASYCSNSVRMVEGWRPKIGLAMQAIIYDCYPFALFFALLSSVIFAEMGLLVLGMLLIQAVVAVEAKHRVEKLTLLDFIGLPVYLFVKPSFDMLGMISAFWMERSTRQKNTNVLIPGVFFDR
jgi:cellulose synthase/poly-beta-1,6-N-acetylglucosamine synthase-like glycosyltransferase